MSFIQTIKTKLMHYTWELAFFEYNHNILTNGLDLRTMHIVKNPYKKKWFADPFILKNTNNILTLLVEEFDSDIKRGRIAQIEIDKCRNLITSCDIILDRPTHLSFPVIYRLREKIFVHPENSASGASYIYTYDEKNKQLVNPVKILDEPVTDAIIIKADKEYRMYATRIPDPNGNTLRLYVSKDLMGPYNFSSIEEYYPCRARMAGQFIENGEIRIRPAQDCDGAYGKAVIFYNNHSVLSEIRPHSIKYAGVHTFNTLDNIGVIDLKKNDFPLLTFVKDIIKKSVWGR